MTFKILIYTCSENDYNNNCELKKLKWCKKVFEENYFLNNRQKCEERYYNYHYVHYTWPSNFIDGFIEIKILKYIETYLHFNTKRRSLNYRNKSISYDPEPIFTIPLSSNVHEQIMIELNKVQKDKKLIRFLNGVDKKINFSRYYFDVKDLEFLKFIDWKLFFKL